MTQHKLNSSKTIVRQKTDEFILFSRPDLTNSLLRRKEKDLEDLQLPQMFREQKTIEQGIGSVSTLRTKLLRDHAHACEPNIVTTFLVCSDSAGQDTRTTKEEVVNAITVGNRINPYAETVTA